MVATASPLLDDRFLFLETLGCGGMGSVYQAFDRSAKRLVALKVPTQGESPGPGHPLSTEFESWSRLRHPNIVQAIELGRAARGPLPAGTPYLVLEHFPGRPAHMALTPGKTAPSTVQELARHVLRALSHVHEAGLVHRDLKPGNILVADSPRGRSRVKLTDFGLAAPAGVPEEPGRFTGSIPYVSPEAVLGRPIDGRADLYGLGILLFYLSTGRMPIVSRDPGEVLRWHVDGPAANPREFALALPVRLARFIARLMSRDLDLRPATAVEALALMGERAVPRGTVPRPIAGRAEIAALRLALDTVRFGGRCALGLPASRKTAAALIAEVRVLAQVHGVGVHQLGPGARRGCSSLGRLVLQLLLDRGPEARSVVEKHGLQRGLPLGLLGGLPVWDRVRDEAFAGRPPSPSVARVTARGIVAFLLESCAHKPMVLVVLRSARADVLAREVVSQLSAEAARERSPSPGSGGLLLLNEKESADVEKKGRDQVPPLSGEPTSVSL